MVDLQTEKSTFRLHCNECDNNTGYFEANREDVVHIDETARAIVFYATCPNGHRHPVDSEYVIFAPEVRQAIESLRSQIGRS
jgi:hypothetical protein